MRFYVECHEMRRFTASIDARSAEEAKAVVEDFVKRGELAADTLDRETIAVRDAWKGEDAA